GMLATDECFHAAVAEWIQRHRALPVELPEFYSGLFYYYPPLFHLAGAAWVGAFGTGAWLALPVALATMLFATLVTGVFGSVPGRAGRWAAALLLVHPAITGMSVRLYVEPLITLLFVWAVALLFRARAGERTGTALLLGFVMGLTLLAKLNAWTLWIGIAITAAWDALRGRRVRAVRLATACALALAIALPWLVRNQMLFGSAFYPAFAPDLEPRLYALNAARFSTPPAEFLATLPRVVGPVLLTLAVAAFGCALVRRCWSLRESAIAGALLAMVVTAFIPFAAARHLNPLIAVVALLSAWGVAEALEARPLARLGTGLAVLGVALHGLATLPDRRKPADPPPFLREALPQVAIHTPANARILSLWTYDTFYVTRRAATWPIPWGQRSRPLAMFFAADPDSILTHLRESDITHVLAPTRVLAGPFDSANYPEAFIRGLAALERKGAIHLAWQSQDLALLTVSPPAPKPDTLPPAPTSRRRPG
ncbi:MAG: hypothetical protein ABIS67_10950, partial [Candidatus Eisenbacteria bacterium]